MHHDIHICREHKHIDPEHTVVGIGDTVQFHSDDEECRIVFHEEKTPIGVEEELVPAGGAGEVHEIGELEGAFEFSAEIGDLVLNSLIIVDDEGVEEGDFESFEEAGTSDLADAVSEITARVLDTIESAAAIRAGFLFPQGIDLIDVSVDVNGVKASVKIAGPKQS